MKKRIAILLALVMLLSLAACGGKDEGGSVANKFGDGGSIAEQAKPAGPLGLYHGTTYEYSGQSFQMADVYEGICTIELMEDGKAVFILGGEELQCTWELNGEEFILDNQAVESPGSLVDGVITIDFMEMGMIMTFVKEGGAAQTPAAPAATQAPETPVQGTLMETGLWSLTYLEDDGWVVDEEELYESEYRSDAVLNIYDEADPETALVSVEINVFLGDPYTFRDWLVDYGFDQYEYAVNNAYDLTDIGGVDCLKYEGEYWGSPCLRYLNRVEEAEATVQVSVFGEYEDPRVATLLSGLSISVEDVGNVDGPWYWNGEPFSMENGSNMVGTFTLNSQWIPINECIITRETFNHAVATAGGKVYILTDGALKQYAFDGSTLNFEADIPLDAEYACIDGMSDGSLWLGQFIKPLINVKGGAVAASYDGPDYTAMHSSGTWGISYFSGPDCVKFDLSGGAYTETPISFPEVSTISHLLLDDNYIYVCGSAADSSGHKVFVYDHNGTLQLTLADSDGSGLGSITYIAQTPNGFIALDGNMREVVLWTADGTHIGTADDGDLFGTFYPWFCGATMLDDGSILVVMTEDRDDQSAMELVAFKLTGF